MPISKYDYIIVYYKEFWPCGLIRRMTSDEGGHIFKGGGGALESHCLKSYLNIHQGLLPP